MNNGSEFREGTIMKTSHMVRMAIAAVSTLVLMAIVAERERFAEGLRASRARIVEATSAESRRLERDLHDGAQQRLTALSMRLNDLQQAPPPTPDETAHLLGEATAELSLAIDELRELAHGMHPTILSDFGLEQATKRMAARSHVAVQVVSLLPAERLDETAESAAYYVIAESLANAEKHSRCSSIKVRLWLLNGVLHVRVSDDGVGGARPTRGSGLEGLRDRVESARGKFRLVSVPGKGTHIHALLPARSLVSGGPESPSDPI